MNRESSSLSPPTFHPFSVGTDLSRPSLGLLPRGRDKSVPTEVHLLREWLSGRASPCQGESRGFDPRLPLLPYRA